MAQATPSALDAHALSRCCRARGLGLKIETWRLSNRLPRLQNPPLEPPKSSQDRLGGSRSAPRAPKSVPRAPKSVPRTSPKPPKSAQERPKSPQERPKSHSGASRDAPESSRGTILRLRSLKKAAFEDDPLRDSVDKRVRDDVRSNFVRAREGGHTKNI